MHKLQLVPRKANNVLQLIMFLGALSKQVSVDGLEDSVQDSASYDASPRSPPPRSLRLDLQRPRSPQVSRLSYTTVGKPCKVGHPFLAGSRVVIMSWKRKHSAS